MTAARTWIPIGTRSWALALTAIAVLALYLTLAACMLLPLPWDGIGKLGVAALTYPLHLLLLTAIAGILAYVARTHAARLACWLFSAATVLSFLMAILPAHLMWHRASRHGVPLSIWEYVRYAAHADVGNPRHDLSVTYATAPDGTMLELDVWRTGRGDAGPLRPAMVIVHGGAWTHGHRSWSPDWDGWLNSLGYEVFDVTYRLPPAAKWRDEVGDVKAALGWVADHAADYHVDPRRMSLMGVSAGGNLALLAANTVGDSILTPSANVPVVQPRTVISLYGPAELARLYDSTPSRRYVRENLDAYIGGSPSAVRDRYHALSPLTYISPRSPPTLAFFGTSDRLVGEDQAGLLADALTASNVPGGVEMLPTADHGFDTNWGGFATQYARARIRDFLAQYDPPPK